jgi:uncharacterized membrane protein
MSRERHWEDIVFCFVIMLLGGASISVGVVMMFRGSIDLSSALLIFIGILTMAMGFDSIARKPFGVGED